MRNKKLLPDEFNINIESKIDEDILKIVKFIKDELIKEFKDSDDILIDELAWTMQKMREIKGILEKDGMVIQERGGDLKKHPGFVIYNSLQLNMKDLMKNMGITPEIRNKKKIEEIIVNKDELDFEREFD